MRYYKGPSEEPIELGRELFQLTVAGPDGEFEVGVSDPGRYYPGGFQVISDMVEICHAVTWDRTALYYGGRLAAWAKFPRGPFALISGDSVTFAHNVAMTSELYRKCPTLEQLILHYFTMLDAQGRRAWRETYECLSRLSYIPCPT